MIPVVEEEEKEVTTKDSLTGEEKKEVVKVPVTKNKVVAKSSKPVAAPLVPAADLVPEAQAAPVA